MTELLTLVPSRGRPENAARLVASMATTCTSPDSNYVIICDDDDPTLDGYYDVVPPKCLAVGKRLRLGPTLNRFAMEAIDPSWWSGGLPHLGFMGDDHLPITHGWDTTVTKALDELGTGIVYGDDGLQGENLPTAAFITGDIVNALGYMVPPGLVHLYIDNAWLDWGRRAECLRYLPKVRIEHLHPAAGKAGWDERYAEVNSGAQDSADHQAYDHYVATQLDADVEKIRLLK